MRLDAGSAVDAAQAHTHDHCSINHDPRCQHSRKHSAFGSLTEHPSKAALLDPLSLKQSIKRAGMAEDAWVTCASFASDTHPWSGGSCDGHRGAAPSAGFASRWPPGRRQPGRTRHLLRRTSVSPCASGGSCATVGCYANATHALDMHTVISVEFITSFSTTLIGSLGLQ